MSETSATCPECGRDLPEGLPASQCPHCLIGLGLEVPPSQAAVASGQSSVISGQSSLITHGAFGDYELIEEIARGGMGVVYKARQVSLDRVVAVKMILAGGFATPEFVQRFRTEAAAAAVLHHPNIVAIHEVGVYAGQHYFSMDFVDGPSLAALVGHQPLPARRAAEYLKTIAEAIHYAHEQGILHRDLKPSNVLIDAHDQPRITDFGLAKRLDRETSLTLSGQMLGSPNFMPPEQATAKHGKVGGYSDVYALGGILYHLLTARPPFQADSLEIIVSQVLTAEPVSPRMLNPSVPRDLETICLKCLEKEPSRRYATAQAMADELGRFLRGEPIQARPASRAEKVWRWCRRKPLVAGLVAGLMFALALGFAGVLWQWQRADRNAQEEARQRLRAEENAYAADMKLAQLAQMDDNIGLTVSLLNKHRPADSSLATRHSSLATDLRGWEWRYLWQLCQGDELSTLHQYPWPVRAVAVSKDGKVLALSCGDQVALWDLNNRRPLTGLPITTTKALVFSPTGNLLAMGTWDASGQPGIGLWDVSVSQITKTLTHEAEVRSVAFSSDGKLLVTFDNRGNIKVADWASDRALTNFTVRPPRRRGVGVVEFSPAGNRLAIGEDYGRVQLLDLRTGTVVPFPTQSSEGVTALVFSADAKLLAAGLGRAVRLWDANSGESRGQLTNHTGWARALVFTPDGRQLASASSDGTIRIWSVADQTELRRLRSSGEGLTALALLPDGCTLVTGGDGGSVCLWDTTASSRASAHTNWTVAFGFDSLAELEAPHFASGTFDPRAVRRLGVAFTPDSRSIITTDRYGSLALWDARSVRITENLPWLGSNHWGVALSPNGRWLAVGNASGILTLWDWTARRAVTNFTVPCEFYGKLGFSRSGNFLFAIAVNNEWRGRTRIWQTGDWTEVALMGNQFAGLASVDLSPDDQLLAAGYTNGAMRLFRFPSVQHEATFTNHQAAVIGVQFSPDGRGLVSTSFDGSTRLWDVFARRELATLRGHVGLVYSPTLSSDGRRMATGGQSPKDAVKLWDLVTHRELLTLQGEGQYFLHLAFSPDGNMLAAVSLDGMAHLWRAPSREEIEAAEKKHKAQ
jgi:eukaryotic-like serine/threonine-protein kinase